MTTFITVLRARLTATAALAVALFVSSTAVAATPTLTMINWEEWVDPGVVQSFEKREKVKVNVLTYTSVEESLQLLGDNAGKVDILVGSSVLVDQLKAKKQLQKLDRKSLPNLKHILPRFNTDPDYAVPYLWGYTGILVRTDKVKTPVRTYAQLLALAKQQPGKVSLMTDPIEYSYAVDWGLNPKGADPEMLARVKESHETFARDYADKVRLYDVDYDEKNPVATGEIIAAQTYSDYATFLATEQGVPVSYVNPDDVCILWMDNLMLLATAPQPALALKFMNYLTDAKISARNAMGVKSTAANPLAMQYYTTEYRNNPVIRPTFEGTERCRVYKSHSPAAQKFYDALKPVGIEK